MVDVPDDAKTRARLQTRTKKWEDACFYTAPDSPSLWPRRSLGPRHILIHTPVATPYRGAAARAVLAPA